MATVRYRRAATALAVVGVLVAVASCGDDGDEASTSPPTTAAASGDTAGTGAFPVTVESCGVDYTFEAPPERVLLGWPESFATLDALGVGDRVVGYFSGSLAALPEGAPDIDEVSPDFAPSREAVVAAGADLVVLNDLTAVAGDGGGVSLSDLDDAGTAVFVLGDYCGNETPAPDTTDAVLDDVRDLGSIFGVEDEAEQLVADIEDRLDAVAGAGEGRAVAFVQIYDGTVYALGGSYYAALLDALDLDNLFADVDDAFSEISAEAVLTLEPDILLAVYDDQSDDAATAVDEVGDVFVGTPAVTEGAVVPVTYSAISAGGITLIDLIEAVAEQL